MLLPATIVDGLVLPTVTSACAATVVLAVEVLFAAFVSALDVLAVAVLLSTVPLAIVGSGCTVMVNCALPPFGSREMVQLIVPLVLQLAAGPVSWVSETTVRP